jgi:hypothetical protein
MTPTKAVKAPLLRMPADGDNGPNGVGRYGAVPGVFPTDTYNVSNC